jgi:inosine/xanthosine triphosphate pyrophosphatase family protein
VSEQPGLRLIAATHNPAKLHELQRVVGELAVIERIPSDISFEVNVSHQIEDGDSAEAIAAQKAVAWSRVIGNDLRVIASDGGLVVPGLGAAWSPTMTRRFAGEQATDVERARRLLELASSLRGEQRKISWKEAIAVAQNGRPIFTATASGAEGILAEVFDPEAIAVAAGFWVSPLWRYPEYGGRLLSDLTPEERADRDDHWHRLSGMLRPRLLEWFRASSGSKSFVE